MLRSFPASEQTSPPGAGGWCQFPTFLMDTGGMLVSIPGCWSTGRDSRDLWARKVGGVPRGRTEALRCGCIEGGRPPAGRRVDASQRDGASSSSSS